ncbi:hypothetical protein SB2_28055 [Methylobacterium radiotolerans]|nr:hypothetical protein SB3_29500 [Methylobacterium radiotolerans]KTS43412.1 hypothetical protein SB2_28055 [Methylobacterium radiotolerans]
MIRVLLSLALLCAGLLGHAQALDAIQSTTISGRNPPATFCSSPASAAGLAVNRADRTLILCDPTGNQAITTLLNAVAAGRRAVEQGQADALTFGGATLSTVLPTLAPRANPIFTGVATLPAVSITGAGISCAPGAACDLSSLKVTPQGGAADTLANLIGLRAPIANPTFTGTVGVPTLALTGSGSTAQSIAIGGNRGDVFYGLQIGGAVPEDGTAGMVNRLEGHATWQAMKPSRDMATMEFALHTTVATGLATAAAGSNQLVWVAGNGRPFNSAWVGRKIYYNDSVLRIASVASDGSSATVSAKDGSAYSFTAAVSDVYTVGYVYGTGKANVAGTAVTRVSGDPFLLYVNDPAFEFRINGTKQALTGFTDSKTVTLANNLGNLTNATYEFFWDANDQIVTFRLHSSDQDIENLSLYRRYDGYWFESQYGGYGKYRDIRFSTGELPYSTGSKAQQVVLHRDGALSLGGDYGWDVLRIPRQTQQRANYFNMTPGPAGFGPVLSTRGSDANVPMAFDTRGNGSYTFTSNNFGQALFQIYGTTNTGLGNLALYPGPIPGIAAVSPNANAAFELVGKGTSGVLASPFTATAAPTTTDIPTGRCADWSNSSAGTLSRVCNVGGTLTTSTTLAGTTASIGGSALAAGACASGTATIAGAKSGMAVAATPSTYPGDGIFWNGYVSAANTVTVKVCGAVASTPAASAYNVRVLQ